MKGGSHGFRFSLWKLRAGGFIAGYSNYCFYGYPKRLNQLSMGNIMAKFQKDGKWGWWPPD